MTSQFNVPTRSIIFPALLALVTACGSATDHPIDASPISDDSTAANPIEHEIVCAVRELGTDELGNRVVTREVYSFQKMNQKLADFAELQAAIGIKIVSDCESARAFIRGYTAYRESNSEFREGLPPKQVELTGFLHEQEAEPPAQEDEAPKILDGNVSNRASVVQWVYSVDKARGLVRWCSATRLAGPLFLTAAHCLRNPTSRRVQSMDILMKRRTGPSTADWYGGTSNWLSVYAVAHFAYAGEGDWPNDLGLIYVLPRSQSALKAETRTWNATSFIAARTPAVGDGQRLIGWGPVSDTEAANIAVQRESPTLVGIQKTHSSGWEITAASNTVRMCRGDSGGPGLRDGMIDGVMSTTSEVNVQCSLVDALQHWTRVDDQVFWMRKWIATLQKGWTKSPSRCLFFSGNPSDARDWEHVLSYVNCNRK